MGNKKKKKSSLVRDGTSASNVAYCSLDNWELLSVSGYTPLNKNPQIIAAVKKIANLVGTITIHLMENTENGDQRIVNGLSRLVDIDCNDYQTRFEFISGLVRVLLLDGDGNVTILPKHTSEGYIDSLHVVPPSHVSYVQNGEDLFDYQILVDGVPKPRDELIHIKINPDPDFPWKGTGYKTELGPVAKSLEQMRKTKDAFMESKWMPSIIVKIDGMVEEFSTPEGKEKILEKYVKSQKAGEPWLIPADSIDIQTVKPLSLNDLALKTGVELDAKTIASILDVPAFFLGVGNYSKDEWNNFIQNRIRQITVPIEQALTKSLLISPEWYFRFNSRSLMDYDIQTLATVGKELKSIGVVTGNEVRDMIGLSPKEGLDQLDQLENYIPVSESGNQKKLKDTAPEGGDSDGENVSGESD